MAPLLSSPLFLVCLALAALALIVILGTLYSRSALRCRGAGPPDRTWNELKPDLGVEKGLLSRPAGGLEGPADIMEHGTGDPEQGTAEA